VKIPGRSGELPGTTKVDADLALRGAVNGPGANSVLLIFIRQGWPQAMSRLPWNHQEPLCGTPFPKVAPDRTGQSYRFCFGEGMRSPGG
jgi:hypothetical protein